MNRQKTGLTVLARFPDVNDETESPTQASETKERGLLESSGRWIGQAMSIKLLAGMTLFLLVGAVLPFCLGQKSPPPGASAASDTISAWQPKREQTPTQSVPDGSEMGGVTIARRPIVRVSATSDQLPPPATLPAPAVARREPPAAPTVAESLMSPRATNEAKRELPAVPTGNHPAMASDWSPPPGADQQPAKPGTEASTWDANRAPAARSPEYEADRRVGRPQREPAAAQFEGTIDGTNR